MTCGCAAAPTRERPFAYAGPREDHKQFPMPNAHDPSRPAAPKPPFKKPRKTEAAFDLWLQKGLHDIFDNVAREPIPDELLRLIEEDRKR